jgi:hypothetical protein
MVDETVDTHLIGLSVQCQALKHVAAQRNSEYAVYMDNDEYPSNVLSHQRINRSAASVGVGEAR